jgi:cobalt-zinc-cadmium efflux system outer membrane protein
MSATPTGPTERRWRWLGLGKGRRRWAACLGGAVCAALSGLPALAGPPELRSVFATAAQPSTPAPAAQPLPSPPPAARPASQTEGPGVTRAAAQVAPPPAPAAAPVLSRDAAVRWALAYNPEIAAIRQQHGIAAAGVIIARTYPFNPLAETRVRAAQGPPFQVINRVPVEAILLTELEVRGQRRWRRAGADAALSRTDGEIATQELALAVRVARAFDGVLYRREKLVVADETLRVTRDIAEQVRKLVDAGRLKAADLILIRAETHDLAAQVNMSRATTVTAEADLRRALGVVEGFDISDRLDAPVEAGDPRALTTAALAQRPDLRSHEAAVDEAEARLKLEIANRFGNPIAGPSYEINETSVSMIGAQFAIPFPVFNRHKGEIRQREAERDRAVLELRQIEVQIVQDVTSALRRLEAARAWVEAYRTTILPDLRTSVEAIQKLFEAADPSVDVLRVLDVRRKLLRARDGYLDALYELRQAKADLAAALGDPSLLAPGLCAAPCPAPAPHP